MTYRVADVCCGYNVRVEKDGEKLDDGIEVEEHEDLLPPCPPAQLDAHLTTTEHDSPTAVYLLRMWKIIIAVMMIAAMWIQRVAEGPT